MPFLWPNQQWQRTVRHIIQPITSVKRLFKDPWQRKTAERSQAIAACLKYKETSDTMSCMGQKTAPTPNNPANFTPIHTLFLQRFIPIHTQTHKQFSQSPFSCWHRPQYHLTNMYHRQLQNTEAGAQPFDVTRRGFERSYWRILFATGSAEL